MNDLLQVLISFDLSHLLEFLAAHKIFCLRDLLNLQDDLFSLGEFTNDDLIKLRELLEYARKFDYQSFGDDVHNEPHDNNKFSFFSRIFRKSKNSNKIGKKDVKHFANNKNGFATRNAGKNASNKTKRGSIECWKEKSNELSVVLDANDGVKPISMLSSKNSALMPYDSPATSANANKNIKSISASSISKMQYSTTSKQNLENDFYPQNCSKNVSIVRDNVKNGPNEEKSAFQSGNIIQGNGKKANEFSSHILTNCQTQEFCNDLKAVIDKKGSKKYFFSALKSFIGGKNKGIAPIKERVDFFEKLSDGKSDHAIDDGCCNQDSVLNYNSSNLSNINKQLSVCDEVCENSIQNCKQEKKKTTTRSAEKSLNKILDTSEKFLNVKQNQKIHINKKVSQFTQPKKNLKECYGDILEKIASDENYQMGLEDLNDLRLLQHKKIAQKTTKHHSKFDALQYACHSVNSAKVKSLNCEKKPLGVYQNSFTENQHIKISNYIELECTEPKFGFNTIKNADGTTIIESVDYYEDSSTSCEENIGKPGQIIVLEENSSVKSYNNCDKNPNIVIKRQTGQFLESLSDAEKADTESEFIEAMANQTFILDSDSFCDMLSELSMKERDNSPLPVKSYHAQVPTRENDTTFSCNKSTKHKNHDVENKIGFILQKDDNSVSKGCNKSGTMPKPSIEISKSEKIKKHSDAQKGAQNSWKNSKNPRKIARSERSLNYEGISQSQTSIKDKYVEKDFNKIKESSDQKISRSVVSKSLTNNNKHSLLNHAQAYKKGSVLCKSSKNGCLKPHITLESNVSDKISADFNRSRQKKDASYIRRIFSTSVRASVETPRNIKTDVFDSQDEVCNVSSPQEILLNFRNESESEMVERDVNLLCIHKNDKNLNECTKCASRTANNLVNDTSTILNIDKEAHCCKDATKDDGRHKKLFKAPKLGLPNLVQAFVKSRNDIENQKIHAIQTKIKGQDTTHVKQDITDIVRHNSTQKADNIYNNAYGNGQGLYKNVDVRDNKEISQEHASESEIFKANSHDTQKSAFALQTFEPTNSDQIAPKSLTVCVRKRPIQGKDIVEMHDGYLCVNEIKTSVDLSKYLEKKTFHFDKVFDTDVKNEDIFEVIKDVVPHVINHGSGCVLAYGQTGTGKTHTMFHPTNGLVFLTLEKWLNHKKFGYISFIEVYNAAVYDLLDFCEKIDIREKDNVFYYTKIVEKEFHSLEQATEIINSGMICRKKGSTSANNESSRSHAILKISAHKNNLSTSSNGLMLVDLAGSERAHDSKFGSHLTRQEGAEINKSLLILKECIRNEGLAYQPFRQSKLTQILRPALLGKAKTYMIATINPGTKCVEHTLNTLQYASRLKNSEMTVSKKAEYKYRNPNSKTSVCRVSEDTNSAYMRQRYMETESHSSFNGYVIEKGKRSESHPYIVKLHDENEPSRYQKFKFDYKYQKLDTSAEINEKTTSYKTERRKTQADYLNKKIENLAKNIIRSSENNLDVKMLRKTCDLLKFVDDKVYDMKFQCKYDYE